MAWPLIGAAIGAGASILGGLMGKEDAEDRRHLDETLAGRNEALQREFAQHGVRWRVEDAKAAGLHPLFALGGAGASYTPTARMDVADPMGASLAAAGQDIGRAVSAQETEEQRATRVMGLQVAASQIRENDARALYYQAEAAKAAQESRQTRAFPVTAPVSSADLFSAPLSTGAVRLKADEVVSSRKDDRSVTAGTHPGLREYSLSPYGLKMRLPYSEEGPSEAMENIPWYMWPAMIQHNRAHYGSDWGTRFLKEFIFDQPPRYRSSDERVRGSSMFSGPARQRVTGRIHGR